MDLKNESGYTLIESLVAMTILVGVLIPLASTVGNSLVLSDTSHQRRAPHLAQSALTKALEFQDTSNMESSTKDGYEIITNCERTGRVFQVTVRVSKGVSSKSLATLHRTVLAE